MTHVQDLAVDTPEGVERDEYEVLQCYQTIFRTDKGETIKIEYRNSSNGYYGGYLIRVNEKGEEESI